MLISRFAIFVVVLQVVASLLHLVGVSPPPCCPGIPKTIFGFTLSGVGECLLTVFFSVYCRLLSAYNTSLSTINCCLSSSSHTCLTVFLTCHTPTPVSLTCQTPTPVSLFPSLFTLPHLFPSLVTLPHLSQSPTVFKERK
ncbi:hypothetical protein OTU49_013950 [Cherax quadricarinatus]|uniref:Secreted protein n=1 Tax=Cherax quadricarinatus TaxID=27406 RepID=A0AAW0VRH9_CHEQU